MVQLGLKVNRVLDIGAYNGRWSRDIKSSVFPEAEFIKIEPIDYGINNIIHVILAEKEKIVPWYEERNTGDSVYKETTKYFKNCDPVFKKAVTLDSLNLGSFDLIKIDTQGSELPILKGGIKTANTASVIILEIPFMGQYNKNVPNFLDHITYMNSIGFIPYDISEYHYYSNILIQIDIIFIRKTNSIVNTTQSVIEAC